MLNQLERLSLEVEGRYATFQELQSVKYYFSTISSRMSAYQKIRDAEEEIIERLYEQMRQLEPDIFKTASGDVTEICRRDMKIILRNTIAAMLIDDLDRLRENILLWQRTIVKAFKTMHIAALTHKTMPGIIEQFLTAEEYACIKPMLLLNQTVFS